jgi:hypothetical protein
MTRRYLGGSASSPDLRLWTCVDAYFRAASIGNAERRQVIYEWGFRPQQLTLLVWR